MAEPFLSCGWRRAGGGGKAGLGGGEEMRGCSEREEMRGVPELRAKAYLDPGVGGGAADERH